MTEAMFAKRDNGDAGFCQTCPHRTDACHTEGCVLPPYTEEEE